MSSENTRTSFRILVAMSTSTTSSAPLNEIAMLARSSKDFETKGAVAKSAAGGIDAYGLIMKSVAAKPEDAAIQFAAALISNDVHHSEYAGHAAKARAGAASDTLLARNLDHVQ